MPGPVPKRSSQRRRTNHKADIDHVQVTGTVVVPELGVVNPHPLAQDFYDSLRISGQAQWYEPSDWQRARLFVTLLSQLLHSGRPSSMMYQALQKDMDSLLVSEAERRRVRMEVDRVGVDTAAVDAKVSQMDRYRLAASG